MSGYDQYNQGYQQYPQQGHGQGQYPRSKDTTKATSSRAIHLSSSSRAPRKGTMAASSKTTASSTVHQHTAASSTVNR